MNKQIHGFTLIELSVVLVIIGLIIGGILLGRDLISAASTRAQIAQIEKYNSAVNTFTNKYGGLPGDLIPTLATQFGFPVGANCDAHGTGYRDGNGLIDGSTNSGNVLGESSGETLLFWQDLSAAGLIDGKFPNNGATIICQAGAAPALSLTPGTTYVGDVFPVARIGQGNFLYVYETGGSNWFGLSAVTGTGGGGSNSILYSNANIPVVQAYNIDKKIDDGLPNTGNVLATYLNNSTTFVQPANAQTTDSSNSCYNTTNYVYSLSASANGGNNQTCALSFRVQGSGR
jgi:prepilin-type N-terminal cleavage/methylation domain-containing protein